jgi:hypothetical protein
MEEAGYKCLEFRGGTDDKELREFQSPGSTAPFLFLSKQVSFVWKYSVQLKQRSCLWDHMPKQWCLHVLQCGSEGLNLIQADSILILEPDVSPSGKLWGSLFSMELRMTVKSHAQLI